MYDKTNDIINVYNGNYVKHNTSNPNNISLSITGHNRIPYIEYINFGNTLFIQNETISSDRVYKADKIIVGKDVNSSGIYGPVIFEKGKIKMYAKEIVFDNNVEIKHGVELEITELK